MSELEGHEGVVSGPPKNGKRKALIIGISKYDHSNKFRDLDFCENDANEVYNILKDQRYDIPSKLVGRIEWSKMRDEINDFFTDKRPKSDDTLFFYFSGHGYLDKNTGRTYLATSEIDPGWPERRAFRFDDLTTYLNDSNSERIVAVLDCCYSGALEMGGKGAEEGEGEGETVAKAEAEKGEEIASIAEANMRKTVDRLIKSGQGKCVLASSLEEQKSFKMEGQSYSLFTYFLTQGLKGANGESVDSNGYVTPELLGSYVNKKMEELPTVKQKPVRKIEVTGQIVLAHYPNLARRQQQQTPQNDYLLQLLREGKVNDFNEIRKKNNYSELNLYRVDLSERNLSSINLFAVDLPRARLSKTNLTNANLTNSTLVDVDLSHADLSNAKLSNAKLSGADLSHADLSNAKLSGADISHADLSNAKLSSSTLSRSNLLNANLSEADLTNANLSDAFLPYSDLSHADLSNAKLKNADLEEAKLQHTNLTKADLTKADLSNANLSDADFNTEFSSAMLAKLLNNDPRDPAEIQAEFDDSIKSLMFGVNRSLNPHIKEPGLKPPRRVAALSWSNLSNAKIHRAVLSNVYLDAANLSHADLSDAKLIFTKLSRADLSNADLSDAKLFSADLSKATISNANLSRADLSSSIMIALKFNPLFDEKSNEQHYLECEDATFDDATIIDDDNLYKHLRSEGNIVPAVVKDKKELREKLEKRGFNREAIDRYLSLSSLAESKKSSSFRDRWFR